MRLIDADDLMRILIEDEEYNRDIPQRADGIRDTMISVMSAPTIEERREGKWIDRGIISFTMPHKVVECSICHSAIIDGGNFCKECGADMRGEKNEIN